MASIADFLIDEGTKKPFAKVPMTVVASTKLDHFDVSVWAYLASFYRGDAGNLYTDPFKVDDIAATLGVSRSTLNRSLQSLTSAGFIESKSEGRKGKRFRLFDYGTEADDFGSFGETFPYHIKSDKFVMVYREMITHGPNARALRLWMILDRISGHDKENPENLNWAFAQRSDMASWLGVHIDTITDDIAELAKFGMVIVDSGAAGRMNRYLVRHHLDYKRSKFNKSPKAKKAAAKRFQEQKAKERKQAEAANLKRVSSDAPLSKYGEKRAADDMAVYWFSQIGGLDWAVRHASRVEHMKSALRIVLRYLSPEAVKKIIDRHLRDNYKTAKPGDLVRILQKFLSDDGKSALRAQIEKVNKIYKLANLDGSDDDYTDLDFIDQSVPDSAFRPEIREAFKEFGVYEDGEEEDSGDDADYSWMTVDRIVEKARTEVHGDDGLSDGQISEIRDLVEKAASTIGLAEIIDQMDTFLDSWYDEDRGPLTYDRVVEEIKTHIDSRTSVDHEYETEPPAVEDESEVDDENPAEPEEHFYECDDCVVSSVLPDTKRLSIGWFRRKFGGAWFDWISENAENHEQYHLVLKVVEAGVREFGRAKVETIMHEAEKNNLDNFGLVEMIESAITENQSIQKAE